MAKVNIIDMMILRDSNELYFIFDNDDIMSFCDCEIKEISKIEGTKVDRMKIKPVLKDDYSIIQDLIKSANEKYNIVFELYEGGQ